MCSPTSGRRRAPRGGPSSPVSPFNSHRWAAGAPRRSASRPSRTTAPGSRRSVSAAPTSTRASTRASTRVSTKTSTRGRRGSRGPSAPSSPRRPLARRRPSGGVAKTWATRWLRSLVASPPAATGAPSNSRRRPGLGMAGMGQLARSLGAGLPKTDSRRWPGEDARCPIRLLPAPLAFPIWALVQKQRQVGLCSFDK